MMQKKNVIEQTLDRTAGIFDRVKMTNLVFRLLENCEKATEKRVYEDIYNEMGKIQCNTTTLQTWAECWHKLYEVIEQKLGELK